MHYTEYKLFAITNVSQLRKKQKWSTCQNVWPVR